MLAPVKTDQPPFDVSKPASSPEVTEMLQEWSDGKDEILDQLLPLVYAELHRQAARYLRRERQDHTLQTTALIHEAAYLKLMTKGMSSGKAARISTRMEYGQSLAASRFDQTEPRLRYSVMVLAIKTFRNISMRAEKESHPSA